MSPTERRINLTGAEIRSYRAGERTLKRRVHPQPKGRLLGTFWRKQYESSTHERLKFWFSAADNDNTSDELVSPFGSPGDRLRLRRRVHAYLLTVEVSCVVTVRRVTVEQVDGVLWWVCEVEG